MPRWNIGPIVGQYQPEDFTERQSANYEDIKSFGIVRPLIFKNWSPREVTLSFVVNGMAFSESDRISNPKITGAPDQNDPEVVWATICAMMRPGDRLIPPHLGNRGNEPRNFPRVIIPGWGIGGNTPSRAVVVDASIKRTHIAGSPPRCVRGIITVQLREYAVLSRGGNREARSSSETQAEVARLQTLFNPPTGGA